jgi:GNAT superfamily N-acetyltransferase
MHPDDLPAVLGIQLRCHDDSKLESAQSFLAKLQAAPASCFMAMAGEAPVGYLVAVPALLGHPPPLGGAACDLPPQPNALHLHDLALHPQARGMGAAGLLVAAFFTAARGLGVAHACLVAVNASAPYWARHGFAPWPLAPGAAGEAAGYGEGAVYMGVPLG